MRIVVATNVLISDVFFGGIQIVTAKDFCEKNLPD